LQQFACRASACIIVTVLPAEMVMLDCVAANSSCAGILMNRGVIFVLNVEGNAYHPYLFIRLISGSNEHKWIMRFGIHAWKCSHVLGSKD